MGSCGSQARAITFIRAHGCLGLLSLSIHLRIALPEVRASNQIISVNESGTFVPEQTPDGVSVLDGPVRSFLQCHVSTRMNTNNTSKLTQYLVLIPLALAVAI